MKLIGAGLPRTATMTQKIALEMLGFGPCYHMVNILGDLDRVSQWVDALEGRPDWGTIFNGFEATVDWPGSFYYRELIDVYPDAKVLLSVRDGAAWARSMRDTIWGLFFGDNMMHDLSAARTRIDPAWAGYMELMGNMWDKSGLFGGTEHGYDESALARAFDRYVNEVQEAVPAERLLTWAPADGWEPLCEFLEVPVPSAPLPRVNDKEAFADMLNAAAISSLSAWQEQRNAQATKQ